MAGDAETRSAGLARHVRRTVGTVRFRITALASVAVAMVLTATAIGLVLVQRRVLTESLDESLAAESAALASTVSDAGAEDPGRLEAPAVDDDAVAQLVVDGEVVAASSPRLMDRALAPPPAGTDLSETSTGSVPGGDGPYRIVSRRVGGGPGITGAVVHVGAPLDDVDESTGLLARSLAVAVPVVTAVLAAVVWTLAGRTLRPVEAIRQETDRISASDLHRRVPVPAGDDEVAELARTMNAMLDRVEHAAERERRFVGDASHELRSPLARMRSEIEVDLAHPGHADPAATHRSVLDETIGMQRLVEDLLLLARLDGEGRRRGAPGDRGDGDRGIDGDRDGDGAAVAPPAGVAPPVDVAAVVSGELERVQGATGLAVEVDLDGSVTATGNVAEIRRAVANVLDNAMRHARSHVAVTLVDDAGGGVLTVTDDGPGVPPADAERIFERFARLDPARARDAGGTGLGLAIAREIVERHGGSLVLDPQHGGGARFVLHLPRPGAPRDGRP